MSLASCILSVGLDPKLATRLQNVARELQAEGIDAATAERRALAKIMAEYQNSTEELRTQLAEKGIDVAPRPIPLPEQNVPNPTDPSQRAAEESGQAKPMSLTDMYGSIQRSLSKMMQGAGRTAQEANAIGAIGSRIITRFYAPFGRNAVDAFSNMFLNMQTIGQNGQAILQKSNIDVMLEDLARLSEGKARNLDAATKAAVQQFGDTLARAGISLADAKAMTAKQLFDKINPVRINAEQVGKAPVLDQKTTDREIYWHGSVSGDLRGGATGLHLGTKLAATEALEARIGVPASGAWDGTREYGQTLLAGRKSLERIEKERGLRPGSLFTGQNASPPDEDYYPTPGALKYADGTETPLTVKPNITAFRLNTEMTNSRVQPHEDFKANGYMKAALRKGNAKRGYYYNNIGEDEGSVSVVVPNGDHVSPVDWSQETTFDQEANGSTPYTEGTITVDGKERPTTNSNGQPIAATKEGLENFWRWFGDSKVVDGEGKPLVVYHGGFDPAKMPKGEAFFLTPSEQADAKGEDYWPEGYDGGNLGQGFYFTPTKAYAKRFGEPLPYYLSIQNPLDLRSDDAIEAVNARFKEEYDDLTYGDAGEVIDEMVAEGRHDGVVGTDVGGFAIGADEWRANSRAQIKSINNTGAFSAEGDVFNQAAYHGSPHRFEKFDLSKIGSGEGAQVQGWGIYFAERESVGRYYFESLGGSERPIQQVKIGSLIFGERDGFDYSRKASQNTLENVRAALSEDVMINQSDALEAHDAGKFTEFVLKTLDERIADYKQQDWQEGVREAEKLRRMLSTPGAVSMKVGETTGNLYKLDIPDEAKARMMDWDASLNQQPQIVQDALAKSDMFARVLKAVNTQRETLKQKPFTSLDDMTGEAFYQNVSAILGSDKEASLYFNTLGIPGVKYWDGGSRNTAGTLTNWRVVKFANEDTYTLSGDNARLGERVTAVFNSRREIEGVVGKERLAQALQYEKDNPGSQMEFAEPVEIHGHRNIVVWDQAVLDRINESVNTLYQSVDTDPSRIYNLPGFYSKMYQHVAEKFNGSGTPEQFIQQAEAAMKSGAFKKDEYTWSGLERYLNDQALMSKRRTVYRIKYNDVNGDAKIITVDEPRMSAEDMQKIADEWAADVIERKRNTGEVVVEKGEIDPYGNKPLKLTKQDILEWLQRNRLEITETVYAKEATKVKVNLNKSEAEFDRSQYPTVDDVEFTDAVQDDPDSDIINSELEWLTENFKDEEDPEDWFSKGNDGDLVTASDLDEDGNPTDETTYEWNDSKLDDWLADDAERYAAERAPYRFSASLGGYTYDATFEPESDFGGITVTSPIGRTRHIEVRGRANEENIRSQIIEDLYDLGEIYDESYIDELEDEFNEEQAAAEEAAAEAAALEAKNQGEVTGDPVDETEAIRLLENGEKFIRVVSQYEDVSFYTEFDVPYFKQLMAQGSFDKREIYASDPVGKALTVDMDTAHKAWGKGYTVKLVYDRDVSRNELPGKYSSSNSDVAAGETIDFIGARAKELWNQKYLARAVDDGVAHFVIFPKNTEIEGVDFRYETRWTGQLNWDRYQEQGPMGNQYEIAIKVPNIDDTNVSQHSWRGGSDSILAHIRFNERTDVAGKKTMFIEEVQSDWHQQGSEKGYVSDPLPEAPKTWSLMTVNDVSVKETDTQYIVTPIAPEVSTWADDFAVGKGVVNSEFEAKEYAVRLINKDIQRVNDSITSDYRDKIENRVADAPFNSLNKYNELVMKRIIVWASANGFERVSWTTGEQQATRWSARLQREIQSIRLIGKTDTELKVQVISTSGSNVSEFLSQNVKNGRYEEPDSPNDFRFTGGYAVIPKTEANSVFGKAITEQLENTEPGSTVEGNNLKINSKGMIEVYDKVMANIANSLVKKFGSKVSVTKIDTGGEQPTDQFYFDVTPEMRESVNKLGLPLFQQERGYINFQDGLRKVIIAFTDKVNLTTAAHEMSHLGVAMHREAVKLARVMQASIPVGEELAPEIKRIVDDWEALKKAVGAKDDDWTVAQEEKAARLFEAYLREGKAPSAALERTFARMRDWFTAVYKDIRALLGDDELNDDVRGVFDRWLASTEEIEQVKTKNEALAQIATNAGLDPSIIEQIATYVNAATAEAEEKLYRELDREQKSRETAAYKQQLEAMKETVAAEYEKRREYAVLRYMKDMGFKFIDGPEMDGVPPEYLSDADAEGVVSPDDVADIFGYGTGKEMISAISKEPPFEQAVLKEARRRLLQKFPDMVSSGRIHNFAVDAIQNDKVMLALDLLIKELGKAAGATPVNMKLFAKSIAQKQVLDSRQSDANYAFRFDVARDKGMREALKASRAGDSNRALIELQKSMVNHHVFKMLEEFKTFRGKAEALFAKVNGKDSKLANSRDIDFIGAARYLLSKFGLGPADPAFNVQQWLDDLSQKDPDIAQDIIGLSQMVSAPAKKAEDLTIAEYMDIFNAIENIYQVARSAKEITVAGRRAEIEKIVMETTAHLGAENVPLMPATQATQMQKTKISLSTIKSALRRVENWTVAMDGKKGGPMWQYVWRPISEATDMYVEQRNLWMTRLHKILKQHEDTLSQRRKIDTGMIKRDALGRSVPLVWNDRMEMIGFLLHTGNESNLDKLLGGYGITEEEWAAAKENLERSGVIRPDDWKLVQELWDMAEDLKPISQKAHKSLFGYRFDEIDPKPVTATDQDGNSHLYRGGYWPAMVDGTQTTEGKTIEQLLDNARQFILATTGRGFTKSRVQGYRQPLLTDLRMASVHIDNVLRFSYLEPTIRNVSRIINNRDFKNRVDAVDKGAITDMLMPWLARTAQQATSPISVDRAAATSNRMVNWFARNASMQLMGYNLVVAIQNVANIPASMRQAGTRNVLKAFARYMAEPVKMRQDVLASSSYMRSRLSLNDELINQQVGQITNRTGKLGKARDFAVRNSRIFMLAVDNTIIPAIWMAGYNEATSRGMSIHDAVAYADQIIRETQGANNAKDISRLEASSPVVKALMPFYGFFGSQLNLLQTEFGNIMRQSGWTGSAKGFFAFISLVAAPAFVGQVIADALRGKLPDDDDDDGSTVDDWLAYFTKSNLSYMGAMVPFLGQGVNATVNAFDKKPMNDRLSISPIASGFETAIRGTKNLLSDGDVNDGRLLTDVANTLGFFAGVPLGQPVKPVANVVAAREGRVTPRNSYEGMTGLITGRTSNPR